jgi:hypothetical protein
MIECITRFLGGIGIPVIAAKLTHPTFLPGLTIDRGAVVYDPQRLAHPGDLLHEAGHLAITAAAELTQLAPDSTFDLGHDLGAIAWSWAALVHLGLDPRVVFHDGGYMGNAGAFIRNFAEGRYVGVPMLEWAGLTRRERYPAMLKWLRD